VEGRTRCRVSGALAALTLAASLAGAANASVGGARQSGIFALLGGTPKIFSQFWTEHGQGLTVTLKIRQYQIDGKTPILKYDVDMQKLIHLVVVRDDFATFAHIHPAFDATTGTFSQPFTKEANHRYYVYADTMPHGIGQQVFRFTLESDGPPANLQPSLGVSPASTTVGPYTVTLARTTLAASRPQTLDVSISENGKPASDLHTYLGAAAHAVFINTATLAYVHVHPMVRGTSMTMGMAGPAGPLMQMTVPGLPAGVYKLWLQFRGAGSQVYTAPFTLLSQ
jgi:hypothetical protein